MQGRQTLTRKTETHEKEHSCDLGCGGRIRRGGGDRIWIGGGEGDWNDQENWDPQVVPTLSDKVIFDSAEEIVVNLGATQAHGELSVANTPRLLFRGLEAGSVMNARNDSKSGLNAPIVFDENVRLHFTAGKVWTNNSTIDLLGGLSCVSGATPTLGGAAGQWTVRGPVDLPGGATIAAPVDWTPSSVSEGTYLNFAGGAVLSAGAAPVLVANPVRISNSGTIAFGGSAPLAFRQGGAAQPVFAINQNVNPVLQARRSMPVEIGDWLALCNAAACNNNKVGFTLGSGANLWLSGDVTSGNARDFVSESPTGGFKLVFNGCGSNVRLTGRNSFQGADDATIELTVASDAGYNSVEFDGEGETIHPFGAAGGRIYTNSGAGVFLRAASPGKTLAHGLRYGASVNNDNAYAIGFDGTNDVVVSGDVTIGATRVMVPVVGDMTVTFAGTFAAGSSAFEFAGTGDVVLGPSSSYAGTTATLNKHSSGSLTLQGALSGTSYNKAYLSGGVTVLDYSRSEESRLNTASAESALSDALRLRGTELVLRGGSVAETVGAGNGTLLHNGLSKIRRDGGSSTIYLGSIARGTVSGGNYAPRHGALDVESGVATLASSLAGTTLDGYVTVGGDHFAAVAADGAIVAADDSVATVISGGAATHARAVVDYLIIESTGEGQALVMNQGDGALVGNKNGIIFRGDYDYAVSGGWLGGGSEANGSDSVVFTHAGQGVFTYGGALGYPSYNRKSFTKSGPGKFRLTGSNDLTVALNLYEGVFEVATESGFPNGGTVCLNGGTLGLAVDATLSLPLSVGDNGGVVDVAEGTTLTQTGAIQTTSDGSSGPVVKRGEGTWLVSGDCTAQSEFRIEEGTVKLGHEWAIGCSTNRTRAIAPTVVGADGTLDVAGFNAHVGNVYLKGGKIVDSSTGGSLGAYAFHVEAGEVAVPLADVRRPSKNNANYHYANNLEKTGPGTVTLSAENEYTGTTFVHDGRLVLTGSVAGPAWVDGGVLAGSGEIAGYAYAKDGGAFEAVPDATLAFGGTVALGPGGSLRVSARRGGFG
ncbi:MAG: autotransporter-associated beta strand repeat-containing protein, partial [Kiritimatiellae bacterium]|nr:autotransporter-associated beta strand repeat-containing protein [Kiritimatiellia bacterium]